LLVALFAAAEGVEVHLLGVGPMDFARSLGFPACWTTETLPRLRFDAVVDASNGAAVPALALEVVEPGRRVVYIGLSGAPSPVDSRTIVLADLTVTGILSGSGGLAGAIDRYASGAVDPRPLVAATIGLDEVATVLAGTRRPEWGQAPKVHVNPSP
jgi:threonine dehydrogenase-like Zn-dependent dehydrogenase